MDIDIKNSVDLIGRGQRLSTSLKYPTEQECELLQYDLTHGEDGKPYEKEIVFGMAGVASTLMMLLFGWVIFKQLWFVWLGMPGWW